MTTQEYHEQETALREAFMKTMEEYNEARRLLKKEYVDSQEKDDSQPATVEV
jgi:hypothetical protein